MSQFTASCEQHPEKASSGRRLVDDSDVKMYDESLNDGWAYVYSRCKEHDDNLVEACSTDIDMALIFAGLFSAVLTAFLVQTYTQMQPDNTQLTAQALLHISVQIANLPVSAPSSIPFSAPPFRASRSIVAINCLWFISLAASLSSVVRGMFAKQWLREYAKWTRITPIQRAVHLRQHRHAALMEWEVPDVVVRLTTTLQVSVVLFFVGLAILLGTINTAVAVVSSLTVGAFLADSVACVVAPLFFETCPWKTPMGWLWVNMQNIRREDISARSSRSTPRSQIKSIKLRTFEGWRQLFKLALAPARAPPRRLDLYRYSGWVRRDIALPSMGQDPINAVAWQCTSLLWIAAHEGLSSDVVVRCIEGLPGAEIRAPTNLQAKGVESNSELFSWPDSPPKRLCAYWLAISKHLGFDTQRFVKPLNMIQDAPSFAKIQTLVHHADAFNQLAVDLRLTSCNSSQLQAMLHLLTSGLASVLDGELRFPDCGDMSPFTDRNLSFVVPSSLCMVHLLLGELRWGGETMIYVGLLIRAAAYASRRSDDSRTNAESLYHRLLDEVQMNGLATCSPEHLSTFVESLSQLGDVQAYRSGPGIRSTFWRIVNVITSIRSSNGDGPSCTHDAILMRTVEEALNAEISIQGARSYAGEDTTFPEGLWARMTAFAGRHRDCQESVQFVSSLVQAHRLGIAQFELYPHFRHYYLAQDERERIQNVEELQAYLEAESRRYSLGDGQLLSPEPGQTTQDD
ncbi:hypothetical protein PUNSTDRAFT_131432 [Punctularia strigosozonata HHB-11173 SS5]|uniref:uncharacterized protein n=1 Tax=Punctularia strigosozonata (strain HHB-11173) TaxID=741275 RepID=UPI0004417B97|nr:uncharacterized protein PUNSTDRAFT_131432 [Punctularia strigosozonata HHB-11173 SS5]EIN11264.1 hypothetical protein PUNSTDRAFT_131432 [Punctularia strigosozonata HHB-11173 SS5]